MILVGPLLANSILEGETAWIKEGSVSVSASRFSKPPDHPPSLLPGTSE
jgi:hypothetical protein